MHKSNIITFYHFVRVKNGIFCPPAIISKLVKYFEKTNRVTLTRLGIESKKKERKKEKTYATTD